MSLTTTAYQTRKAVNFTIFLVIFIVVARILLGFLGTVKNIIFPPPPPVANYLFGEIPPLQLASFNSELPIPPEASYSYTLQTIEGTLPQFQPIAPVFMKPIPPEARFGAEDQAITLAKSLAFETKPERVTDTSLRFVDDKFAARVLLMDLVTRNFLLSYDFRTKDPSVLTASQKTPPNEDTAKRESDKYLGDATLFREDFDTTLTKVSYYELSLSELRKAVSLASAQITRVDYFRKPLPNIEYYAKQRDGMKFLPELPLVTLSPDKGNVYLMLSGRDDKKQRFVEVGYLYWEITRDEYGMYPLKPIDQAWNELKGQKGYIAALNTSKLTGNDITITDVSLGYLDQPEDPTVNRYVQPVYIFRGTAEVGFLAYVPALGDTKLPTPQ
ncbi:MAG TPA: hypothetical protein VJ179_03385 [Patescibacteria group bacterium]|nr:hypothetical protein [Patescibacteria group bacterium]